MRNIAPQALSSVPGSPSQYLAATQRQWAPRLHGLASHRDSLSAEKARAARGHMREACREKKRACPPPAPRGVTAEGWQGRVPPTGRVRDDKGGMTKRRRRRRGEAAHAAALLEVEGTRALWRAAGGRGAKPVLVRREAVLASQMHVRASPRLRGNGLTFRLPRPHQCDWCTPDSGHDSARTHRFPPLRPFSGNQHATRRVGFCHGDYRSTAA